MEYITQATEDRIRKMVKEEHAYGDMLEYILRQIKEQTTYEEGTVTKLKKKGVRLYNKTQVSVYEDARMNGLAVRYPELIGAVFCRDLHYLNIYDFNKLVKIVTDLAGKGCRWE